MYSDSTLRRNYSAGDSVGTSVDMSDNFVSDFSDNFGRSSSSSSSAASPLTVNGKLSRRPSEITITWKLLVALLLGGAFVLACVLFFITSTPDAPQRRFFAPRLNPTVSSARIRKDRFGRPRLVIHGHDFPDDKAKFIARLGKELLLCDDVSPAEARCKLPETLTAGTGTRFSSILPLTVSIVSKIGGSQTEMRKEPVEVDLENANVKDHALIDWRHAQALEDSEVKEGKTHYVNTIVILSTGSTDRSLSSNYIRSLLQVLPDWKIQIVASTQKKQYELLRNEEIFDAASKGMVIFTELPPSCAHIKVKSMLPVTMASPEFWETLEGDRILLMTTPTFYCGSGSNIKLQNLLNYDYYGYSAELTSNDVANDVALYRRSAVIEVLRANRDKFTFYAEEKKAFCAECEIRDALVAGMKRVADAKEGKYFVSGKNFGDRPLFFNAKKNGDEYSVKKELEVCEGFSVYISLNPFFGDRLRTHSTSSGVTVGPSKIKINH